MDWAIDSSGEHIRAGSQHAERDGLRCPVCKARVHHRNGHVRRAYFAHFSGNSNQACELYHPSVGAASVGITGNASTGFHFATAVSYLEAPALIWRDDRPIPVSLWLRLPRLPVGYASTLRLHSPLGQQRFPGELLAKAYFAQVALQEPPASVEASPRDPAIEIRLKDVLQQFRLTGNFFRAHVDGGVLEARVVPLELGETYVLVTQRCLPLPHPDALEILQTRTERNWTAYRLRLRDVAETRTHDVAELRAYLEREIVPARPKIDLLWPPPNRLDPDGTRIHATTVCQLIVRSNAGPPIYRALETGGAEVTTLGKDLYAINLASQKGEALVGLPGSAYQQLRFEDTELIEPKGVVLSSDQEFAGLHTTQANELAHHTGRIAIQVPTERLWQRVRINLLPLRPCSEHREHALDGPLLSLDCGAFGRVFTSVCITEEKHRLLWYARFENLVVGMAGPLAWRRLDSVRTKEQLLHWAAGNGVQALLPLMLSAFLIEVDRGLS